MIVGELVGLANWLNQYLKISMTEYEGLANILENNARQGNRQPVEQQLQNLKNELEAMPVEQLTAEQIEVLKQNEVLEYLGPAGVEYFDELVKKGAYDPATVAVEARKAHQTLASVLQAFQTLDTAISAARVDTTPTRMEGDGVLTRVHFQHQAAITNVVELERWSEDWLTISRGLAAVADERPEDVRVVGASTGSVIVWLMTSVMVATLIALLVKRAHAMTLDVVSGLNAIENLRHTRVMNKAIEDAMNESVRKIRENAKDEIVKHLVERLDGKVSEESKGLLARSVEKFLNFTEKGGRIDMVAPPAATGANGGSISTDVQELRGLIEDARKLEESLPKQLPGPDGAD